MPTVDKRITLLTSGLDPILEGQGREVYDRKQIPFSTYQEKYRKEKAFVAISLSSIRKGMCMGYSHRNLVEVTSS
jgi:hypothetical protein